ncbi:hypothetical protein QCA50_017749 [Cerrena zonata]|uniref:Endonuclease/exonuclease/phosphatase domain-containing protein n=1 Tax=Cerrena zonata TaxID=2478898 RepID=A0AAW0FP67_9APHY
MSWIRSPANCGICAWDSGPSGTDLTDFWNYILTLYVVAPYSWSIIGDCNAAVALSEVTFNESHISASQYVFNNLLSLADGFDVWVTMTRSQTHLLKGSERSIPDRLITSHKGSLASTIRAHRSYSIRDVIHASRIRTVPDLSEAYTIRVVSYINAFARRLYGTIPSSRYTA